MAATAASLQVVVGADITGALRGLNQINRSVQSAGGFFGRAASTAAGFIGGALGLAGLQSIAGAASDSIFGFNASLEQSRTSFGVMLGSGEKANAFLGNLQSFALATPFEFPQLVSASQRMLAFGFAADQVLPLLTDIGNAASASPSGFAQGLDRISLALGQMQAKGRVQGDELLQLQEAGINTGQVFAIMAQQTGLSVAALQQMQTAGKLGPQTFIKAFQAFSQMRFGGLMEKQSQTFTGAVSNIKDGLRGALATAFLPFFETVRAGAVRFAAFLITPQFAQFVANIHALVAGAMPSLQAALEWLIGNAPRAWAWLAQAGAAVQQFAAPLFGFLTGAGGAFLALTAGAAGLAAVGAALAFLLSPIGLLVIAAGLLGAAWATNFGDIQGKTAAAWAFLQPILTDLWAWLGTAIPTALTTLAGFWTGTLQPALESVWGFISSNVLPVLAALGSVGLAVLGKEVETFAALWTNVLQPALAAVAGFLSSTVLPVLQGIWNWFATKLAPVFAAISAAVKSVGGAAPSWLNSLATSITALPVGTLPSPATVAAGGARTVDNSLSIEFTGPVSASTPEDRAALAQEIARARDQAASADAGAGMPEGA